MHPTVTAILVAHRGADHLRRSLEAVAEQTRKVDSLVVIVVDGNDDVSDVAAAAAADQLLASKQRLPYGAALSVATRGLPPASSDDEWLWFLGQDTAPAPDALERLIETVAVSPSVAIAGPKLLDWDEPTVIRELGISMTRFGATVVMVEDELDQAQHDRTSDMLAVPSAGMLVRHRVWDGLGGFDPALPVFDDGLDLCVRARLAGHRVVIVPTAKIASAGDGVSVPMRSPRGSARLRQHRQKRAAQLHRRMAYAAAAALVVHWISLVPLAVIRSIGRLISKQPDLIPGEFAAAFGTAFGGGRIGPARAAVKRARTVSWRAIAPLRVPLSEVRRMRAMKLESSLVRQHGERREIDFFSGGGAWVVLATAVMSVALFSPLLGATQLSGGGILPLDSVGVLWSNIGYGWRDIGIGFSGAADPFTAVLAILGTLTFWQPSFSIVLLWLAALPLAALGGWFLATRLTHRAVLRATFALVWALGPMLFDALQQGRPAAVVVHILLPWLFFAGTAARRSWASSATTSILAAAIVACAPVLGPALLVIWVIGMALSGRGVMRMILIPVPTLVLFAPLAWEQMLRGTPFAVFADPGAPVVGAASHPLHIALGFADGDLGGWQSLAESFGMSGVVPSIIVPILLAPIGVLALLALFLRGTIRATLCLVGALLGFVTAVVAVQFSFSSTGAHPVALSAGPALSLYWLGLVAAATMALVALGRFALLPAVVAVAFVAVAIAPIAIAVPLENSVITTEASASLPAYVTARAQTNPRTGTLELTPQSNGSLAAEMLHGAGDTLDAQSTLSSTSRVLTDDQKKLATLAGNLASDSGLDASDLLRHFGVSFVLLQTTAGEGMSPASATQERAETSLDANALLTQVASTDSSLLWSVPTQTTSEPIPPDAGGWQRVLVLVALIVVFGLALLMALPTGRTERGTLRRPSAAELAAAGGDTAAAVEPDAPEPDAPHPDDEEAQADGPQADGPEADESQAVGPEADEAESDDPVAEDTDPDRAPAETPPAEDDSSPDGGVDAVASAPAIAWRGGVADAE